MDLWCPTCHRVRVPDAAVAIVPSETYGRKKGASLDLKGWTPIFARALCPKCKEPVHRIVALHDPSGVEHKSWPAVPYF